MEASRHHSMPTMPNKRFCNAVRKFEAYSPQPCEVLNTQQFGYSSSSNGYGCSIHILQDPYCTLESSLLSNDNVAHKPPSTVTFSPNESLLSHQESHSCPGDLHTSPDTNNSPISGQCLAEDMSELWNKLKELEDMMLGPDSDFLETHENVSMGGIGSVEMERMMVVFPRGDLKQALIACAMAVSNNDMFLAQWLMSELRQVVSVYGEPIQRLGAYMLEGLVARLSASGSSIYKSLKDHEPTRFELLSSMHTFYEICPHFKFGYMSANGAIADAMKDEERVHIIDFQIGQGRQWMPLIQAFAARPSSPPHIRITGVDDATSAYARGGGLSIVGRRLSKLAETFKVPFEFHAATMSGCKVHPKSLTIRPGEALAVNLAFMLHHMPDESVSTENHRDRLLRAIRGLNPKVVTLVEHELNTNTAAFQPRFREALEYYTAAFESIDAALPRVHRERINVEQHCLARDVVNVIACEGADRVERHEPLGKWQSRFRMAGFTARPLSSLVNATIKAQLEKYCDKYRVEERDGALHIGWLDRDLVASCAWN